MPSDPDYIVNISRLRRNSAEAPEASGDANAPAGVERNVPASGEFAGRAWIGVYFACCGVYLRVYRNAEGTAYRGCCPGCGREAKARVGPSGVTARFFSAE